MAPQQFKPLNHTMSSRAKNLHEVYRVVFIALMHQRKMRIGDRQWHNGINDAKNMPSFFASCLIHFAADFSYFASVFHSLSLSVCTFFMAYEVLLYLERVFH